MKDCMVIRRVMGICSLLTLVCLAVFHPSSFAFADEASSSYSIDIPADVPVDAASLQAKLPISGSIAPDQRLDVSVSSANDFKLDNSGFSLPYSLSGSSLSGSAEDGHYVFSFDSVGRSSESDSNGRVTFSEELTVSLESNGVPRVSGNYQDKLTFSYSCSSAAKLTFDANGGEVEGSSSYETAKKVGAAYGTLPTPQWEGHVFEGWYTAASGGSNVSSDDVMSGQATTLYAHWRESVLTINYWNDGAQTWRSYSRNTTISVSDDQLVEVEKVTYSGSYIHSRYGILDVSRFQKTGYRAYGSTNGLWRMGSKTSEVLIDSCDWSGFASSSTEAKGFYVADYLGVLDKLKSADVTVDLYPIFVPNTYHIAYDGNGATSGSMAGTSCTYDVPCSLRTNEFIRESFEFEGWNTVADGSGTAYGNEAEVKNLTATNGSTVKLYAQWHQVSQSNFAQDVDDGPSDDPNNDDAGVEGAKGPVVSVEGCNDADGEDGIDEPNGQATALGIPADEADTAKDQVERADVSAS